MAYLHERQLDAAIQHLTEALKRMPHTIDKQYDLGDLHFSLGKAYLHKGLLGEAQHHVFKALQIYPKRADIHYELGLVLVLKGYIKQALVCYKQAIALDPAVDTSAAFHYALAEHYAQKRDFNKAISSAQKALSLAQQKHDEELTAAITRSLDLYDQVSRSLQ